MNALPEPLVSAEIDLRDFPYMPLDVVRLRDSDLSAISSAEGFRAAVLLWCASWHQRPAASLPNDDRSLALLAGFGRDLKAWKEVREEAMRGFVECSDSRLYHPVVAEKAREAWDARLRQRARTEAARAAKAAKSQKDEGLCDRGADVVVTENVATPVTENVTGSKGREGKGIIESQDSGSSPSLSDASQPAPRKASRAKPRTQIAEDAQPSERDKAEANRAGLSAEQFRSEWRKFRDHHRAKGSLMADWSAAWRTWIGNMAQFQPARAGPLDRGGVGKLLAESYGLGDAKRDEKASNPETLRGISFDDGGGRDANRSDAGELSRNTAADLIAGSFRRV